MLVVFLLVGFGSKKNNNDTLILPWGNSGGQASSVSCPERLQHVAANQAEPGTQLPTLAFAGDCPISLVQPDK